MWLGNGAPLGKSWCLLTGIHPPTHTYTQSLLQVAVTTPRRSSYRLTVISPLLEVLFLRFHLSQTHSTPPPLHFPFLPHSLTHVSSHKKNRVLSPCLPCFYWAHCLISLGPTLARALSSNFPPAADSPPSAPQATRPLAVSDRQGKEPGRLFNLFPRPRSPCSWAPSCGWEASPPTSAHSSWAEPSPQGPQLHTVWEVVWRRTKLPSGIFLTGQRGTQTRASFSDCHSCKTSCLRFNLSRGALGSGPQAGHTQLGKWAILQPPLPLRSSIRGE